MVGKSFVKRIIRYSDIKQMASSRFKRIKVGESQDIWVWNEHAQKTAVVMAGVHPEEEAGVYCIAHALAHPEILNLDENVGIILIPCRSPGGFSARDFWDERGQLKGDIVFQNQVGWLWRMEEAYVFLPTSRMVDNWKNLVRELAEYKIHGAVYIVSLRRNSSVRANGYYFDGEKLYDSNSSSHWSDKVFQGFDYVIRKYKPGLILDLHEGLGMSAYWYLDENMVQASQLGNQVSNRCQKEHIVLRDCAEDRIFLKKGQFSIRGLQCFSRIEKSGYQGIYVVVEGGIEQKLEDRVKLLERLMIFWLEEYGRE